MISEHRQVKEFLAFLCVCCPPWLNCLCLFIFPQYLQTLLRTAFLHSLNIVVLTFPFLFQFFQNSLIKRIQGENVYIKHSNLMLEVGMGIY